MELHVHLLSAVEHIDSISQNRILQMLDVSLCIGDGTFDVFFQPEIRQQSVSLQTSPALAQ
jgi:hypothetical protein